MKLIKNSKLVVVVDGSSGFEAMLAKPVVTFTYFIFHLGLTVTNKISIISITIFKRLQLIQL